ncbi:DNA polymerase III subunit gamma/tau [Candidatus Saccharibacteria bacterium]|nr:MAG: DNA polymerase III subunit gamma/tau [Candidatus Saccharibacteria bacterium]
MGKALYREYRPKKLSEVVGQEHVTTTLGNALKQGRISHAYLLTGPRGVGKTSIARILAHEINGLPYEDEAHLDIIEIDAASNRRIDEIRDLRDKVNTAPSAAKYKVYIIDEVHMLTKEAFNALLKTLEEPPAHVVFILATTEAHKLPETIVSRTQRYAFRPVPADQVVSHLKQIAKTEKIAISDDALALIAEHGDGSFRDSISLLDQSGNTGEKVEKADVERILGLASAEQINTLQVAVTSGNTPQIVSSLSELYASGFEPAAIAQQLGAVLREDVLAGKAGSGTLTLLKELLNVPTSRSPRQYLELTLLQVSAVDMPIRPVTTGTPRTIEASGLTSSSSQTSTRSFTSLQDDKKESQASAPEPKPSSDVILSDSEESSSEPKEEDLSTPFHSAQDDSAPMTASTKSEASETSNASTGQANEKNSAPTPDVILSESEESQKHNLSTLTTPESVSASEPETETTTPKEGDLSEVELNDLWQQTLNEIKKQYNTLYGIARMATPELDGDKLTLNMKFAFHQKRINEAKNRKILGDVFSQLIGRQVEIFCVVADKPLPKLNPEANTTDVSAISNIFGGAEVIQ